MTIYEDTTDLAKRLGMSLSLEELEQHLKKITYKPGWEIWLMRDRIGGLPPMLGIDFKVENAYRPGETVKIGTRERLQLPIFSTDQLEDQVYAFINRAEEHETREWFKVDGVMKYDPHRGL